MINVTHIPFSFKLAFDNPTYQLAALLHCRYSNIAGRGYSLSKVWKTPAYLDSVEDGGESNYIWTAAVFC